jgi:MEMO1 family protein
MAIRRADFAGSWYPGTEQECRRSITDFMSDRTPCPWEGRSKWGGIVPHAGWLYSGKIAANVIHCLMQGVDRDLCILFGGHLPPGGERFIMKEGAWETPLGPLEVDAELGERLVSEFSFRIETPWDYLQDNTIELELPFIKYFSPGIKILPMGLPPEKGSLHIARRAVEISKSLGRKTVVLGSTDLTHYGVNYGYKPKGIGPKAVQWVKEENDAKVVALMVAMNGEAVMEESLENHNACCPGAAAACIAAAGELGAVQGKKIEYSTSYDLRPDSSFVGYVGVLFGS